MRNIQSISIALPLILGITTACGSGTRFSAESQEADAGAAAAAGAPSAPSEAEQPSTAARPHPVEIRWVGGSSSGGGSGAGSPGQDDSNGGRAPSPDQPALGGQDNGGETGSVAVAEPREVIQTLHAVAALSGVLAAPDHPERLYGFVSFDLRELPEGIVKLDHALVQTGDYVVLAPVPVLDVSFDELAEAPSSVPDRQIVTLPIGLSGDQLIPEALWPTLATDYANRAQRPYAQFRFDLPAGSSAASVTELLTHTSIEIDYFVN